MHHKNFHILNYKIIFVNVLLDIRRIFTIRTAGFQLWKNGRELFKENKQEKKKENTLLTKKTIKKKKKVFHVFLGRERVF